MIGLLDENGLLVITKMTNTNRPVCDILKVKFWKRQYAKCMAYGGVCQ